MRESHVLFAQTKKKRTQSRNLHFSTFPICSIQCIWWRIRHVVIAEAEKQLQLRKKKKEQSNSSKGHLRFFFFSFNVGIIIRWR